MEQVGLVHGAGRWLGALAFGFGRARGRGLKRWLDGPAAEQRQRQRDGAISHRPSLGSVRILRACRGGPASPRSLRGPSDGSLSAGYADKNKRDDFSVSGLLRKDFAAAARGV